MFSMYDKRRQFLELGCTHRVALATSKASRAAAPNAPSRRTDSVNGVRCRVRSFTRRSFEHGPPLIQISKFELQLEVESSTAKASRSKPILTPASLYELLHWDTRAKTGILCYRHPMSTAVVYFHVAFALKRVSSSFSVLILYT